MIYPRPKSRGIEVNQSPRPKMRTLADREAERQRLREVKSTQTKEKNRKKPGASDALLSLLEQIEEGQTKAGRKNRWSGFESDAFDLDSIAIPLVEHGWSRDDAIAFARKAIQTLDQQGGALCKCGERARGASERYGARCVECLLELEHGIILKHDPDSAPFGQRRRGTMLGDPSPWQENAVRGREGE